MFELRVLNGLHQGAALPLFGEQWCIGASTEADLALYDPGIATRHAWLRLVEQRWCVQAEEGLVQDEGGQVLAQIVDLAPDLPFSIGAIRLCVSLADQPWPAEPVLEPEPVPLEAPGETQPNLALVTMPKSTQKRVMGVLLVVAVLVTAVGMMKTGDHDAQASLMPAPTKKIDLATAPEVRKQLHKMLNERELAQRVSVQVINGQISLSGDVSPEEMALLSRMLGRFAEQFDTPVPVISRVSEGSSQPPFKITQIVGGPNGHVVLEDGRRLFLGDEVDGLRLVAIDNAKVIFDGQRRYEVRW
ncbi:FHA domain-containing protein [Pseudomonas fildesensis]|jgi:type III secretion protein D|uniref:Type III secretion protein n=1 Tax=Pseudomonas fildesensis TaxID=1674920 RepID=A0A0J8IUY6_9PSED|nr:FHA domain-containing protein [Pseudomonas fildesensis]KMT55626.1 type III secretion protein [Pseudomonas fildesensis]